MSFDDELCEILTTVLTVLIFAVPLLFAWLKEKKN